MTKYGYTSSGQFDEEIVRLRSEDGLSTSQIAEKLSLSTSGVHRRLKKLGFTGRAYSDFMSELRGMTKDELAGIYAESSSEELAERAGCAVSTINRLLVKRGVPRRRNSGWLNLRLQVITTVTHKFFAHKLVEHGLDLRWDWVNYPVLVGTSNLFFLDIAVPEIKFGIEIDGSTHEGNEEKDAQRDSLLESEGWQIHHLNHSQAYFQADKYAKSLVKKIQSAYSMKTEARAPGCLRLVS